ncbi:MAG TPA: tail fiber domain-containing protein [Sediminibacterium sp.]|nr:tail fiber domain-containing protein [Sediminibacterium sp.]
MKKLIFFCLVALSISSNAQTLQYGDWYFRGRVGVNKPTNNLHPNAVFEVGDSASGTLLRVYKDGTAQSFKLKNNAAGDSLLTLDQYGKFKMVLKAGPLAWDSITGKPSLLISGNNLADVSNVATARDNLSVYSKSVVDDSLLNHYTKGQADGRFKGIGWLPGISDVTGLPDSLTAVQGRIQTKQQLLGFTAVPDTRTVNGHALSADISVTKSDVGLSNVPNTDATNAANISSGTLPDARLSSNVTTQGNNFNSANQLVKLDGGGKLPTSTIPSLALVETFVVSSQSAMLALSAQMGDVAVRTDNNKSYILQSEPATTLANWIELLVPSSEADPVYTASSWFSTTNNSGNWNTAYGWGPHSGLYRPVSWVPSWSDITGTVPTWNQNTTGNAATATTAANTTAISGINSNLSSAVQSGTVSAMLGQDVNNNLYRYNALAVQTFLGLGPMAYQSTGAWVDLASTQTISGVKTFSGGIRMTGGIVFGESGKSLAKMNSSGTYYGGIQNTSSDRWALTYSNTTTDALGTEVLAWTPSSVILSQALSGTTAIFNNSGYSLEAGSPGASQKVRIGVNSTGYSSIQGSNYSNTATDLTINPDGGNVGVNTTTPSYKFETSLSVSSSYVGAFSNATDNLRILIGTTSGGVTNIQSKTISTNVPYQLLLNAEGGRVGIGSGSPMYTLDVFGTGRFADEIYTNGVYSTAFGPRVSGGSVVFRNWAGATLAYLNDAGAAIFGSSLTTGAGMYAKDIVSINSNAYPSTYPTSIGANTSAEGFIQLGNNSVNRIIAGSGSAGGFIDFVVNNTTVLPTGADGTVAVRMASTGIVSIYSSAASTSTSTGALIINGGLGVAGAIWAGSGFYESDARWKNINATIETGSGLDASRWTWKEIHKIDDRQHWGYKAQDVLAYLPEAVSKTESGHYGVEYNSVFTYKIAQLEKKNNHLEQRISELEKLIK